MNRLPHSEVYVRIKTSPLHGVGVFAIRDIPKGVSVFSGDKSKIVWVDKAELQGLDSEIRKFYDDFCIIKGDKYGCPDSFNNMTIGWYLNESKDKPNVECTDNYNFITARDIRKGEELLVDYATFSEYPK